MRKVSPGLVCIVLGVVLLLAAGGLYAYNRYEDAHAGAEAQTVVARPSAEGGDPGTGRAESGPLDPDAPGGGDRRQRICGRDLHPRHRH